MRIRSGTPDPLTTLVELEGQLDLYAAAQVNATLARAVDEQIRRLIVDVRDVTRIDFSLIAILIQTGRTLGDRRGTLEVLCNDDEIGRLLAQAGEGGAFGVRFDGPEGEEAAGRGERAD